MSVIANTTIISNFASIGQLSVLKQLFSAVYITVEVYQEIQSGLEEGYQFYSGIDQNIYPFASQGWIHLISMRDDEDLLLFNQLPSTLQRGEASCLAIAHNRNWLFLTDDKAARKSATNLGVRLSGTLGCLVLSIERNLYSLEQANRWLTEMMHLGYRSPVTDLTGLLKQ
jgi:predicted nucleic acid-binding protein